MMGERKSKFNTSRLLLLAVAAVLATMPALAQNTKPPERPETARFGDPTGIARQYQGYLSGVIKKIGKDEIVLTKTRFGVDTSIKLLAKTKYVYNNKPGKLKDLKVGDLVFVDPKTDKKTGDMSAKKIVSGIVPVS
jgi:hypothetical protein